MGHCGFCFRLGGGSRHRGCIGSPVLLRGLPPQDLPGAARCSCQFHAVSAQFVCEDVYADVNHQTRMVICALVQSAPSESSACSHVVHRQPLS